MNPPAAPHSLAKNNFLSSSTIPWILTGLFIAYLLFFYRPIYENSHHKMFFPNYVPTISTVGEDLTYWIELGRKWIVEGTTPYASSDYLFPPLAIVPFIALSLLRFSFAFRIASGFTMLFFFFSAFIFPLAFTGKRSVPSLVLLLFGMGLLSYGFQFEIERGQFNVVVTGCALLAVLIYRSAPRYRLLALILFTVAIQLKIYPAIFIFLFIEDGRAWRSQIRDLAILIILNLVALFALGLQPFLDFIRNVLLKTSEPYIWIGNMSAKSFAAQALPGNPAVLMALIFGIFCLCLAGAVWAALARRHPMARAYLFLACTIGAMIIPAVSHDYKLPILIAPVSILFDGITLSQRNPLLKIGRIACLVVCSAAFGSTLFSFTNKITIPYVGDTPISLLVQNNLPALMVLLVGFAFLAFTQNPDRDALSTPVENTSSAA